MRNNFTIGVIGVGAQGARHARVYSEMKNVDGVYVYDSNHIAAHQVANRFGLCESGSIENMLKNVDAVSICVPTKYHYDISKMVMESGIHCLIEKPLCNSIDNAKGLINFAKESGVITGVGNIERFNPIIPEIKRIIRDPLFMVFSRHNPTSNRMIGTNVVEDLMIHDIDIATKIFNDSKSVWYSSSLGSNDVCCAMLSNRKNNCPIILSASRKSSKKIRSIYIEQENCTIEGDYMNQEVYIHKKPDMYEQKETTYVQENIVEKISVNRVEPLKIELSTFVDCVKTNTQFPVSLQDGYDNLVTCDLILSGVIT